jgi:L-amino acid N-acyltransferase YncA
VIIRRLVESDYPEIVRIYLEGIATGLATFETSAPDWPTWNQSHLPTCRLAAVDESDHLLGWAALSPVSNRCVYAGVAENSLYVSADARGQGVGRALLTRLVEESEAAGLWTIQAGITAGNEASIHLHSECGFRMVGYREKIGRMNGVWYDTVIMERRSEVVM